MKKRQHIETRAWLAGGMIPILLKALPPKHYCRGITIHVNLCGSKVETDTESGDTFGLVFSLIRLGQRVNISGWDLDNLYRHAFGKRTENRTAIPGSGTDFDIDFDLYIPFMDPRMTTPDDSAIPTELLHDFSLELNTAAATCYGDDIVITSGTIYVHAELVATNSIRVPTEKQIGYLDPGGQSINLDSGAYSDLFLTKVSTENFTAAEVTLVTCNMEGEAVLSNMLPVQLCSQWNIETAMDQDPGIAWVGPVLPIVFTSRVDNKVTKLPVVGNQGGVVQIQGTETEPHVVYWRSEIKDEARVAEIGRKQGLMQPEAVEYETRAKKGMLETEPDTPKMRRKVGLLPGKYVHPAVSQRRVMSKAIEVETSREVMKGLRDRAPASSRRSLRRLG